MTFLGLDCGSSSVKAAILRRGKVVGRIVRAAFPTRFDGTRAEVDPAALLAALGKVIAELGASARKVDCIALSVMSPSWVAMDGKGRALTAIVTHQDRRSIEEARALEAMVGRQRHLRLAGNRPFPGGISSTTWAWYLRHQPAVMRKADLVGHLSTLLHLQLTGQRVIDPSNASFMGLYSTLTLGGWNDELCEAVGISRGQLPEIFQGDQVAGGITGAAAGRWGLTEGTPVLAGVIDGSAGMLLVGAQSGRMVNVSGSTDVLGVCTDRPRPHAKLLTRALGIGRRWMAVSTLAAAGSALTWAHQTLFADLSAERFFRLVDRLGRHPSTGGVGFEPYLAGERTSIEQRTGGFTGLRLASTREEMLSAIIESLARASGAIGAVAEQRGSNSP